MANKIDQKEYLKRYLKCSSKKKKKKIKPSVQRMKIIDDDIDISQLQEIDNNDIDLFTTSEDAPQIAGIIDERPIELQLQDRFTVKKRWKVVNNDDGFNSTITVEDRLETAKEPIENEFDNKNERPREIPNKTDSDSDVSVKRAPTKRRRSVSSENSDYSPPRRSNDKPRHSVESNIKRDNIDYKKGSDSDYSPPRHPSRDVSRARDKHSRRNDDGKRRRDEASQSRRAEKPAKTLDGKKAGLQNAHELKIEIAESKRRINEQFKQMPADVVGKDVAPIQRDRKTGRIRDFEQEAIAEKEKEAIQKQQKEKYSRWGKGLKQVEDHNEKIENDLYEMSKPLARYADDEDLERYLKEQEREGDPMLEYMRKERRKAGGTDSGPSKLKYEGAFMPNRFGISPGHRWDGVDRSNGYEKSWFDVQNAKKANEEEAYKWSTEDM